MIKIKEILLCDEFSEGQFNKVNLIGCNLAREITVERIPYMLSTTLVILGEIHKPEGEISLKISIAGGNQDVEKGGLDISHKLNGKFNNQPFSIILPVASYIKNFDPLDVNIWFEDNSIFQKTYRVIQGASPYFDTQKRLATSSVLPLREGSFSINTLIQMATEELYMIDQYITPEALLEILEDVRSNVNIRILSSPQWKQSFGENLHQLKEISNNISIRFCRTFHDRFVFINNSEYYHFGHSLKDVNKGKVSRYSKVITNDEVKYIAEIFENEWNSSEQIIYT